MTRSNPPHQLLAGSRTLCLGLLGGLRGSLLPLLQLLQCRSELPRPRLGVSQLRRQLITPRSPKLRILSSIDRRRLRRDPARLLPQPPLIPVRINRGTRGRLISIHRDRAEPAQTRMRGQPQHLAKQLDEGFLMRRPEPRNSGMLRPILSTNHPERHIHLTQPVNLPRRPHPVVNRHGFDAASF